MVPFSLYYKLGHVFDILDLFVAKIEKVRSCRTVFYSLSVLKSTKSPFNYVA